MTRSGKIFLAPASSFQLLDASRPHPLTAVSRPDLDTDFYSNISLFDLNLAERCMTLPADTVWPRLGLYLLLFPVLCLATCMFHSSIYNHFSSTIYSCI